MLGILGIILFICGAILVYAAKYIVCMNGLEKNVYVEEEKREELSEEELNLYIYTKALLSVKIKGMLIILPSIIIIYLGFK